MPRSGEFPAMSFDLNDGFRLGLAEAGITDAEIITDSIGFGEDIQLNHSKAEKLVMNDNVDLLVAYATSLNAEALYDFAKTAGKPILFLDAGMELFELPPSPHCYHITLQGTHASRLIGREAAQDGKKIICATSFYDGGYRAPWAIALGIEEGKGSVCGNYVSVFKPEEFSIDQLIHVIENTEAQAITVCFSMYLAELFMKGLKEKNPLSTSLPFYCTPFTAEEQWLEKCDFPGGTFHTIVPWSLMLENPVQQTMKNALLKNKNKTANLFSLLGWEAAFVVDQIIKGGASSLNNWSFESPRGTVRFHPDTHCAYAPLYNAFIEGNENGKCRLRVTNTINIQPEEHLSVFRSRPEGEYTRWRNNYFCI